MKEILQYFPDLTSEQIDQYRELESLYQSWNEKINLISRKDIQNISVRHILHSLSLAKVFQPAQGWRVLDVGTGGGLPGLPLAIMFPHTRFHLVDSIGKKIHVVNEISEALGLTNVQGTHANVKDLNNRYDAIVTRAVARLSKLTDWCKPLKKKGTSLYCLKGGDLSEEIAEIGMATKTFPVREIMPNDFFKEKVIVQVSL